MKAILIDPFEKTVTEVDYDGSLEQAYALTGCNMIEQAHLFDRQNVLLVDEEGLFKPNEYFLIDLYPQPLAGKALMVADGHSSWTYPPTLSVEDVRACTHFK